MRIYRWDAIGFLLSDRSIVVLECRLTGMRIRVPYSDFAQGMYDDSFESGVKEPDPLVAMGFEG